MKMITFNGMSIKIMSVFGYYQSKWLTVNDSELPMFNTTTGDVTGLSVIWNTGIE